MDVTLLYFDDCPNWEVTERRLSAIAAERPDIVVTRRRVESDEEAVRIGFHGSPSILIDGVDAFPSRDLPVGLACRVYRTPEGLAGSPTSAQLREALGVGS